MKTDIRLMEKVLSLLMPFSPELLKEAMLILMMMRSGLSTENPIMEKVSCFNFTQNFSNEVLSIQRHSRLHCYLHSTTTDGTNEQKGIEFFSYRGNKLISGYCIS